MTDSQKAAIYDDCIRQSDALQREISKLKSEYLTNMSREIENKIRENEKKIAILVGKIESLF